MTLSELSGAANLLTNTALRWTLFPPSSLALHTLATLPLPRLSSLMAWLGHTGAACPPCPSGEGNWSEAFPYPLGLVSHVFTPHTLWQSCGVGRTPWGRVSSFHGLKNTKKWQRVRVFRFDLVGCVGHARKKPLPVVGKLAG